MNCALLRTNAASAVFPSAPVVGEVDGPPIPSFGTTAGRAGFLGVAIYFFLPPFATGLLEPLLAVDFDEPLLLLAFLDVAMLTSPI